MPDTVALVMIAAAASAIVALAVLVRRRVKQYAGPQAPETEPFSLERYQPMARLLSGEDLDFLRRRTRCSRKEIAAWERESRRVFRMYLQELTADFRALHAQARALVAESPEQYADLVGVLMRQQTSFWRAIFLIEIRLVLRRAGLVQIDTRRLLGAVTELHAQLARVSAPAQA